MLYRSLSVLSTVLMSGFYIASSNDTSMPSQFPTIMTEGPTSFPTEAPTENTDMPTMMPTSETDYPSMAPSMIPTTDPTFNPTMNTDMPTLMPTPDTDFPTLNPTMNTAMPTLSPSDLTQEPTLNPTGLTPEPTKNPTKSPTESPTASPTVDLGSEEVVIEVKVAMIGPSVANQCSGNDLRTSFRKDYGSSLRSIYASAVGVSDEDVKENFISDCDAIFLNQDSKEDGEDDVDTDEYGDEGIAVTFSLSSDNPEVLNVFEDRFNNVAKTGEFFDDFESQLDLLFGDTTISRSRTSEVTAEAGNISEPGNTLSDAEKMNSIWLLPGLLCMFAGILFYYQTRSIIDPNNQEEFDRFERLRGERAMFEKEFGTIDSDANSDGDLISHDLPPADFQKSNVELVNLGADAAGAGQSSAAAAANTTSGGTSGTLPGERTELAGGDDDQEAPIKSKPQATSYNAVTSISPKSPEDDPLAQAQAAADPQPLAQEKSEEAIVAAPAATDDGAPAEGDAETEETGAPSSVQTALKHSSQPSASESFDPTKYKSKEEAKRATQSYLDNLWEDADGDDAEDEDSDYE